MCEGQITIPAKLWKKILWDKIKIHTFWQQIKINTIISFSAYAGMVSVYVITKNRLLINPIWILAIWGGLTLYHLLRIYISINQLKQGYSFYAKLDKDGVELSDQKIPWEDYAFYLEYEDYLEIHHHDKSVSFLPKNDVIQEILDYTRKHIALKE